ncbi:MAG: low specificity L-threonine aldolase, partial [Egibacteraceae bacterium]
KMTNIVYVEDVDAAVVCAALRDDGVLAGAMDARTVRLVTHPDVSAADCRRAAEALRRALAVH